MTRIVIAGGHGQIALLLEARLSAAGHTVQGLLRRPDGAEDLVAAGAEPVVFDLESATAAVAGRGDPRRRRRGVRRRCRRRAAARSASTPSTSAARCCWPTPRSWPGCGGSCRFRPWAPGRRPRRARTRRGWRIWTRRPRPRTTCGRETWTGPSSGPGGLLNIPGLGLVHLLPHASGGTVPRADVADVLAEILDQGAAVGQTLELVSGSTPIPQAVASLEGLRTMRYITLNDGVAHPAAGLRRLADPRRRRVRIGRDRARGRLPPRRHRRRLRERDRASGRAMQDSGVPREDVFLTTKLWNGDHGYDAALRAFDKSLERLGTDYVDLYLIHWPVPEQNLYVESWRALEKIARRRPGPVDRRLELHRRDPGAAAQGVGTSLRRSTRSSCTPTSRSRRCGADQKLGIVTEEWSPLGQGGDLLERAAAGPHRRASTARPRRRS